MTPANITFADAPIGSRWYAWGHHCTVVEHIENESGELRVVLHRDKQPKPDATSALLRGLVQHGLPSGAAAPPEHERPRSKGDVSAGAPPPSRGAPTEAPQSRGPRQKRRPTVATTDTTEVPAVTEVKPDPKPGTTAAPAAPKKAAAKKAAAPKNDDALEASRGLYETLVERTKSLAKGVKVEKKMSYARCGIGGKRGQTLVYIHFPTARGVSVHVPSKTAKGGYQIVRVAGEKDVAKAMTVIEKRAAALAS